MAKAPRNGAYLDSLAWCYFKAGRRNDARELLKRATVLSPKNAVIKEHLRIVTEA